MVQVDIDSVIYKSLADIQQSNNIDYPNIRNLVNKILRDNKDKYDKNKSVG